MKTVILAKKRGASIFDPRKKGSDEESLLRKLRPDLLQAKKEPSNKMKLARRVLDLRLKAGLSQREVAERAGIGVATYQRIEECQPVSNPSFDVLEKLAFFFEVRLADLVDRKQA